MKILVTIVALPVLVLGLFMATGCTPTGMTETIKEWTDPRHLVPVPMRSQIFNNMPTRKIKPKSQYLHNDLTPEAKALGYGKERGYYASEETESAYGGYNEDSYDAGFEDGCHTFSAVVGTGTMRLMKPRIDGNRLSHDQWYLRGYQDAASWCTFNLDWELH
jgi:hypothetical protein